MHGTCELRLTTNFTVGCDDLGAPHLTIGTRYPVGEHIVLPRKVKSRVFWANTVRPYGYACACGLQMVRRVVPQGTFSCPSGNSPCRTLRYMYYKT